MILHLGAKKREDAAAGIPIPDPQSLLQWLAPDRAITRFRGLEDIEARRTAFADLVRAWIEHV